MLELGQPPPIYVNGLPDGIAFPPVRDKPTEGLTPVYTELFRAECLLPEALQAAYERRGEGSEMRIVSAGCSTGQEVDSLLAHIKRSAWSGQVAMRGWDINEYAIIAARSGRYFMHLDMPGKPEWEGEELERVLDEYGFEYTPGKVSRPAGTRERPNSYLIDAAPVRQGSDLEFMQCDLSEEVPAGTPADLITANNMLHHLTTQKAEAVIQNLAHNLGEGGVLSVGDTDYGYIPMKGSSGSYETTYGEWLLGIVDSVCSESGIELIASNPKDLPTMFAKV
jgi:chemotaxis methyl-accepting protein methylase